jgi:hypothetical protein
MTKQRYNDRLIGTLIGCIISVAVLRVVHEPLVLLGVLFVALVASAAFVTIKYRYTAIAACVQVLIQINLLMPGSQTVVAERLIDTVIGGIIASVFSFVLPSWEYRAIPKLVENVLEGNRRYIAATRDLLLRRSDDDFAYRVERKRFMDGLSALISSFQRMLDEPRSRHRAVDNLNRFIVQNYLVAAHVAAARIQVRQHYDELDVPAAEAAIVEATDAATRSLQQASERLKQDEDREMRGVGFVREVAVEPLTGTPIPVSGVEGAAASPGEAAAGGEGTEEAASERRVRLADSADRWQTEALVQQAGAPEPGAAASSTGRAANAVLERRLRALRADAAKIALRTGAIGRAIRQRT